MWSSRGRDAERIRLAGLAERKPRQLSGGQQQCVALARAIVYVPPVLLIDEPLGALENLRTEMQAEMAWPHVFRGKLAADAMHVSFADGCPRVEGQDGCRPGCGAAVVVRPERLSIMRDGEDTADGRNVLTALVADVASFCHVRLRYGDGAIGSVVDSGGR